MSLKLQQRAEEQTDAKVQDACAAYINLLANRYRGICKENGIKILHLEGNELEDVTAVAEACLGAMIQLSRAWKP